MAYLTNRMSDLTMLSYFTDIHFINVSRAQRCLLNHGPFRFAAHASLELLREGRMRYIVNGVSYVIQAPVMFWNVPGKTYEHRAFADVPRDQSWADFTGPRAIRIARALDRMCPNNFMPFRSSFDSAAIFDEMIRLYQTRNADNDLFQLTVCLERMIGLIYEEHRRQKGAGDPRTNWHRLSTDISEHPFRPWDFNEQARRLHVSYSHFRRLFHTAAGMPPHDYLLTCRARHAARELQRRNISVKQLAYELGFDDPSELSRLLKTKLGAPPSAFIRKRLTPFGMGKG